MSRTYPIAYTNTGKEIFPRQGMMIPAGSLRLASEGFSPLTTDMVAVFAPVPGDRGDCVTGRARSVWQLKPISK